MGTTPVSKRPSDRIGEIIKENHNYFVTLNFDNYG